MCDWQMYHGTMLLLLYNSCSPLPFLIVKSGTGKCSRLPCCCSHGRVRCCCYCSWLFEKRQKTLVGVSTLIFCVSLCLCNLFRCCIPKEDTGQLVACFSEPGFEHCFQSNLVGRSCSYRCVFHFFKYILETISFLVHSFPYLQ